jgi:ATP-binding protein involved in chromosome partitioning
MFGKVKPTENEIRSALSSIDHISIDNVMIDDGKVRAILSCDAQYAPTIEIAAEQAIKGVKGVKQAQIIVTAEQKSKPARPANTEKIKVDAKRIIAVASGKGGVGKSTVAMNIACGLAQSGEKVGLLDADIYGPSIPRMTGLSGQKPEQNKAGKIIPLRAHNVDVMSIGFMIGEENPLIWRGPMVQSAFTQLLQDVAWEGIDTLVIDLPPGTGDIQLTMSQRVPLTGAIIVSTPQDIALIDVRKGIEMFQKVNVPIMGLIENMSYHVCPSCGHQDHIFGHGGAKDQAEALGIPFLGEIPLNAKIRQMADKGEAVDEFYDNIIKELLSKITKIK